MLDSMKKVLVIGLCLVLITSLMGGCGKKEEVKQTDAQKTESGTGITPVTFTYWSADTTAGQMDDDYKSPVSKKMQELTGVTLEKEFAVGDPREKLSIMAASGEYPDFIYGLEYNNIIVDAGGYIKLDELIEEYGPNIKKMYGDSLSHLKYSAEDPCIYYLGLPNMGLVKYRPETGFELQHAVVKELGYPKMETLQDYEDAIKAYMEKYPEIDGKPTIGLSLLADDWRIKISLTNPAVFATGAPDDGEWYYDKETGKAILHLTRPEEKEYFRWLNHMNDIGLLDPESFVQKYDQYQAKIAEGRVLALADAYWEYEDAQQSLVTAGKDERTYGMYPLVLDSSYKYADLQPTVYTGGYGVGISTSCKDPVAAIKFLDWMCSDEAQILARWGIEGVNYEVVNGKRAYTKETFESSKNDVDFGTKTGIGIYNWPWPGYGDGAVDANGDNWGPVFRQNIVDQLSDVAKETLAAYDVELWRDLYPSEEEFEANQCGPLWQLIIPSSSDSAIIMQKYDEITAKRIPAAILASPEKFDTLWDEYMAELESVGIHELEDEFNKLIQKRMELWSK